MKWSVFAFLKKVIQPWSTDVSLIVKDTKASDSTLSLVSTMNELDFGWRNRDLSLKVDSLDRKLEIAKNALVNIRDTQNLSIQEIKHIAKLVLINIEEPKTIEPKSDFETAKPKRGRPRSTKALF